METTTEERMQTTTEARMQATTEARMQATTEARTQAITATPPQPTIEEHAARLAARQHGIVTRRQLLEAGFAEKKVDRRVAAGVFLSLHRGVYLLGTLRGRLEPEWARVVAALHACGADAVVSHASAGWLWRLLRRPCRAAPVSITVPEAARRQRPGILIHRSLDLTRAEITRVDGIPVTGPGRTVRDLSTVLTVKELNRAAARAERKGLIDSADFPELVARHGGRPGAPVLRVEVDGFEHHRARGTFENDHQRDLELEARGVTVLRVTWRQLVEDPKGTAGLISRSFGHAEARAARLPVG